MFPSRLGREEIPGFEDKDEIKLTDKSLKRDPLTALAAT